MSKVYLVSVGSYSDYEIAAVFSTKELAEAYIREQDEFCTHWGNEPITFGDSDYRIEERDLDVPIERPPGTFIATVYDDGYGWSRWNDRLLPDTAPIKEPAPAYMSGRKWAFIGYGATREHARRSAEELRRVTLTEPFIPNGE